MENVFDMSESEVGEKELKYNKVFDILNVFRLERFLLTVLSVQILSLTYNLMILPLHLIFWVTRIFVKGKLK